MFDHCITPLSPVTVADASVKSKSLELVIVTSSPKSADPVTDKVFMTESPVTDNVVMDVSPATKSPPTVTSLAVRSSEILAFGVFSLLFNML